MTDAIQKELADAQLLSGFNSNVARLQRKDKITNTWRNAERNNRELLPFCQNCFNLDWNKDKLNDEREYYAKHMRYINVQEYKDSKTGKITEYCRNFRCAECRKGTVAQMLSPEEYQPWKE